MISRLLMLGLLGLLSAGLPAAEDEALHWLDRMSQAVQQRNYVGTFVYLHNGRMETMRVVHRRDEDGERERLHSLTGVAREVLRDNEKVTCILPDRESVMVRASKPRSPLRSKWLQDLERLTRYYEIRVDGEDRVIGRLARVIAVQPRDPYRYGHRLWLDVESDLMLKSMVQDEQGRTVEQMMFTELELPATILDSDLQPALSGQDFTWKDHRDEGPGAAVDLSDLHWEIGELPPGFQLKHHNRYTSPDHFDQLEHLVYGDGLATISVYIEPAGSDEDVIEGGSRRGAVNAFGTLAGDYQVTAVGEVPMEAVELVAQSVRRLAESQHD
ncbi:MAG TPA: MucB/RseB C-terminal domain-containing protein [Gammaproteobacteria bacterium]